MNCKFCNEAYDNKISLSNHTRHCKSNPSKITLTYKKKSNQWSNPDYQMTPETKQKISNSNKGKVRTQSFKDNLSKVASANGLGGHTSKKRIVFVKKNGETVFLQSSYETRLATLLEENNIEWSRPAPLNWIDQHGKSHRYYPDFEINGKFFDTKNDYLIQKDADKINRVVTQNNVCVFVLRDTDIHIEKIHSLL